ncbi:MAG: protein phosphatase 2C domain-containing protein [Actinobacteria bacterium]|nr:protein phosphatase 2C domain-containing protein [Actinomycetota bacterium]
MIELTCVFCEESVAPADHFCESCGAEQPSTVATTSAPPAPTEGCRECSAPPGDIDPDGYCGECGRRQPPARDHMALDRPGVAGVTDRGQVHATNQDAMALARAGRGDGGWAAIVADGVSSSPRAEDASQAAVDAASAVLAPALDDDTVSLLEAINRAADAARRAVAKVSWSSDGGGRGAPACTLAIAAWRPGGPLAVLSIGDARCYWLGADGANCCLTEDDSWAAEQLAQGADRREIETDDRFHAVTNWLGVDAPPIETKAATFDEIWAGGRVVVCSDGLWNYAPSADEIRVRVDDQRSLIDAANHAAAFANDAGGHDNITVVVAHVPAAGSDEKEGG